MPAPPSPVSLTLVLAGGASLGAYHAGVLSALVTARNALAPRGSLRIDAVGGASAGALVSLLAAWAVAAGRDPVWLLRESWVDRVDLDLLRSGDGRAPLSFDTLRERFVALLEEAPPSGAERAPVSVHVSLTGLRGLTYGVGGLRGDGSIRAATYADWFAHGLRPDVTVEEVCEPVGSSLLDAALASAANPGGFAPRLLDRSADRDVYRQHGLDRLPEPLQLWFADGGLVQSEPVGRVVATADDAGAGDAQRVAVLVDPRSEDPGSADEWADPGREPTWVDGIRRSLSILPAHMLYEDLRRLVRDNARLRWVERLTDTLMPHLDEPARDGLRAVLSEIATEEQALRPSDYEPGRELPDDDSLEAHLRRALAELAGVTGKSRVDADVISPLLLADEGSGTPGLLAGEMLGDFGGFLDRRLRRSDFDLGYASALVWLREGLAATAVADDDVAAAIAAVEDAHDAHWRRTNLGAAGPGDLDWRARAAAARLALQLLRVTGSQLAGRPGPASARAWGAVRRLYGRVRDLVR